MNILLVDDDNHKASQISECLATALSNINVVLAKSFHSGINHLINDKYDVVLLDMSMPTYDFEIGDIFNRHRNYAGEDFLYEMESLGDMTKTIIITQYDVIGEGKNRTDAKQLDIRYQVDFKDFYLGMIHYDPSLSRWRDELLNKIRLIEG